MRWIVPALFVAGTGAVLAVAARRSGSSNVADDPDGTRWPDVGSVAGYTVPYWRTEGWAKVAELAGLPITLVGLPGDHALEGPVHAAWVDAVNDALGVTGEAAA